MNLKDHYLKLNIIDCLIVIHSPSINAISALDTVFGSMRVLDTDNRSPDLFYRIYDSEKNDNNFIISREGITDLYASDLGEMIFLVEKDITLELQRYRSDLMFIHSASLNYRNKGFLLVAPSGTGKSTTAWGLVNNGCGYLSDELAPLNLDAMCIHPYPHALCLKSLPPLYNELPLDTLYTSKTIHINSIKLVSNGATSCSDLKAIIFLTRTSIDGEELEPKSHKLGNSEAMARLYSNTLNTLAHDIDGDKGFSVVYNVVRKVPCYQVMISSLDQTCELIKSLIKSIK